MTKANALPENIISVFQNQENETIISVDSQAHTDYGFAFPLTYEFDLPLNSLNITALKKYSYKQNWDTIKVKNAEDFFNHDEAFRVDEAMNKIFISVGFGSQTDSIYLQAVDNTGEKINITFIQITKYYDNREAAVTASADDMASWSQNKFAATIEYFLQYNLYLTLGINTSGTSSNTYEFIQKYLDSGFIEAGAHSRTHPGWADYQDYDSEITGCREDIINNLVLPELYSNGDNEYVYTWIAPHGYFDDIIDSLVGQNKYLVNRLYFNDFEGFGEWNQNTETYVPIGVTRAFDPPSSRLGWGIGTDDINDLNNKFDDVISKGSVYHVMCHPNVVEWNQAYPWEHLEHISNKKNIWYVSLGHLYVYHLAQENYINKNSVDVANDVKIPSQFKLYQNYPNPFNQSTVIKFTVTNINSNTPFENTGAGSGVLLKIYDILGREIATLVDEYRMPGSYEAEFNAGGLTTGIYICRLRVGSEELSSKMVYLK